MGIPEIFTDKYINDEIKRLSDSISSDRLYISNPLTNMLNREKTNYRMLDDADEAARRRWVAGGGRWSTYSNPTNEAQRIACLDRISGIENTIKMFEQRISESEAKKRELIALLSKTEEQRAEEHYQLLLKAKESAFGYDQYFDLAMKFRQIKCYKDADVLENECSRSAAKIGYDEMVQRKKVVDSKPLATEMDYKVIAGDVRRLKELNIDDFTQKCEMLAVACEEAALKARTDAINRELSERYERLVTAKKRATTEKEYIDLAELFRMLNGYLDSAELAVECENAALKVHYDALVTAKKRATTEKEYIDLAKQFRMMDGYLDTAELAVDCDNKYYELNNMRQKQERKERRKRFLWKMFGIMLIIIIGGIIGGAVFAAVRYIIEKTQRALTGPACGIVGVMLSLCWWWLRGGRLREYDDLVGCCGWGCGGFIAGFAFVGLTVAANNDFLVSLSNMKFCLIGACVGVLMGGLIGYKKYNM